MGWERVRKSRLSHIGVALTAVAVIAGAAGCGSGDDGPTKKAASAATVATTSEESPSASALPSPRDALRAAAEKISGAKSVKFSTTGSTPVPAGTATGGADGMVHTKSSGVQGWKPAVKDMTMDASALGFVGAGYPATVRVIAFGSTQYENVGGEVAKVFGGKEWLKIDFAGAAKGLGNTSAAATANAMDAGQDPSSLLGPMLNSPNVQRVGHGPETTDGVRTEHYGVTLTLDDMAKADAPAMKLSVKQAKDLLDKQGVTTSRLDLWISEDGYPVRSDTRVLMAAGSASTSTHYADFSSAALQVRAPAADQTFSPLELQKAAGASS
jgi:hypothetical protein